jgi:putative phosphoribosyl transferase
MAPLDMSARHAPIGREVVIAPFGVGGYLARPKPGYGIILFAHGSGSGRHSPRNQFVARTLQQSGFGTLLFDLLTGREAQDRNNVFDIDLLAERLRGATDWLREHEDSQARIGYFGASTGAGAALAAAADAPQSVAAIVSRGGRPDLAGSRLSAVTAPTLLVVGGADTDVLALNRRALAQLAGEKQLSVVPGATHLFEEPGTLEQVVDLANHWFETHLNLPS